MKSDRKGSPGLLSILPLPGSIFYPFCPSFLDNYLHRIRKNKMNQLSVFDKGDLKIFISAIERSCFLLLLDDGRNGTADAEGIGWTFIPPIYL